MIRVLEWDSIIVFVAITHLFNSETVKKEMGLGGSNRLFGNLISLGAYILPYSILFHPKYGIENLEYLQAQKQICFHQKYLPHSANDKFLVCVFQITQGK